MKFLPLIKENLFEILSVSALLIAVSVGLALEDGIRNGLLISLLFLGWMVMFALSARLAGIALLVALKLLGGEPWRILYEYRRQGIWFLFLAVLVILFPADELKWMAVKFGIVLAIVIEVGPRVSGWFHR